MWLRLQQEDLALPIGEAVGLRGLNLFNLEASEKCFDVRRASVEQGFKIGEGNVKLSAVFGSLEFAAFDPAANGALTLADAPGGFDGGSRKCGKWSMVPPHFTT